MGKKWGEFVEEAKQAEIEEKHFSCIYKNDFRSIYECQTILFVEEILKLIFNEQKERSKKREAQPG